MLQSNAVGKLQTVVICPSCDKTGKDAEFKDCCFRFALMRLGIQDRRKCPLCGEGFVSENGGMLRDKEGFCYAYENCNEEHCKGYKPYKREYTNGCNSECQHHSLGGRCTL